MPFTYLKKGVTPRFNCINSLSFLAQRLSIAADKLKLCIFIKRLASMKLTRQEVACAGFITFC